MDPINNDKQDPVVQPAGDQPVEPAAPVTDPGMSPATPSAAVDENVPTTDENVPTTPVTDPGVSPATPSAAAGEAVDEKEPEETPVT